MEPRDIVAAVMAAFNAHDLDSLMRYFADNYELRVHTREALVIQGKELARTVFAQEFAEAADRRATDLRIYADGPVVTVLCRDRLTHPSLGPLDIPMAMIFEVHDGSVASCDAYQDTAFWQ